MSNITHFPKGKQVQISEHQLLRLLESIRTAKYRFAELQALAGVIAEKSSKHYNSRNTGTFSIWNSLRLAR